MSDVAPPPSYQNIVSTQAQQGTNSQDKQSTDGDHLPKYDYLTQSNPETLKEI